MLEVRFQTEELERLYSKLEDRKWYYPPAVIRKYIKLVNLMQAVDTLSEINTFWWYKIEQKKWNMKWIWAARLSDTWRLEFSVDNHGNIQIVTLQRISHHYWD